MAVAGAVFSLRGQPYKDEEAAEGFDKMVLPKRENVAVENH